MFHQLFPAAVGVQKETFFQLLRLCHWKQQ